MKTYDLAEMTRMVMESKWQMFSGGQLRELLEIEKESSAFKVIVRLIKARILERIERDKYIVAGGDVSGFELANFLY